MRNLASTQKIKNLQLIEGADAIEKATVLGWQLVVKKGEFKIGDMCIYCEIDSVMPDNSDFEFLKPRGMRIKTVRLRGQISQGICFPFSLAEKYGVSLENIFEGQDVTSLLGIIKYEPPIPANLSGEVKGGFPSFIPKTDETRVQVLQPLLDKYKGTDCYITEKLDGSSITYYLRNGEFGVCSRNLELKETETNSLWIVAKALNVEDKLRSLGANVAIQGEIIGEGIQGNKYKLKRQTARFFNLFYIDKYEFTSFYDFRNAIKNLELDIVPVISENYELENDINTLVRLSTAKSILNPDVWREGIVIRPVQEIIDSIDSNGFFHNDRVSFKVINPEFLIKYGE